MKNVSMLIGGELIPSDVPGSFAMGVRQP